MKKIDFIPGLKKDRYSFSPGNYRFLKTDITLIFKYIL